ncbi:MAG TPA: hypothetical protein VNE41_03635 [Chitinophagaceae bacterium]|nr:hypothetical protein [Chitinophagaceae bacterium]
MLKGITWGEYLAVMSALLAGYYLIVGLLYYAPKLGSRLQGLDRMIRPKDMDLGTKKILPVVKDKTEAGPDRGITAPGNSTGQELVDLSYQLSTVVLEVISRAAACHFPRQELIMALQSRMGQYQILAGTEFRTAIDHLIKSQCERICSICLNEGEINMLWKGRADGAIA